MRVVPVIRCSDLRRSVEFYTKVLGFEKKYPDENDSCGVVDLIQGDAGLQLSRHRGDGVFGCAINIRVEDVDALFQTFLKRGLDTSGRQDSPVHNAPVDQTWGIREFYVSDHDGNTLRFGGVIER